ncbi:hypothetical protein [Paracoccus homiensis]|uniref:Iron complex transport system substrate-binding protein n=1 Tax=Paracoccus homiensis TaxID=364199 RepID=A0A1I0JEF5_9RHOB|nr:hypothetical protein [Paracoccus homiensis]SEU08499.1 iron complex transport system substrate-binding protein [Paracoccus homiensis]
MAIGDPNSAARAIDRFDTGMASAKDRLAAFSDRPFCVVKLGDARHLRAFGKDSMFGSVLERLGLRNSWIGGTRFSFLAPVPIERLIEFPDANLVVVGEVPPQAQHGLSRSVLWKALPQVADRRTYHLPEVNAFGGLPAAMRFARLLAHTLNSGPTELA